jgi:predicted ATPase
MENNLYLKEVSLSGYKSIIDVNIEFQRGINIIIGKNAAGKTNFLKFFNKVLSLKYDELNNFESNLIFKNGKEISITADGVINTDDLFKTKKLNPTVKTKLSINKKSKKDNNALSIEHQLLSNNIVFNNTFLCHGIPKDYLIVDAPFTFKFDNKNKISNEVFNIIRNNTTPYFVRLLLLDFFVSFNSKNNKSLNVEEILSLFGNSSKKIESLKKVFFKFSPIEDLRFSENFNIFLEDDSFTINNIFLEFKIDGNWHPFSNLSDGTKRIFYIISEVYDNEVYSKLTPTSLGFYLERSLVSKIILIEEPELGLHPHQFHKLMLFLKEESINKQIIITTHSPQALDILEKNELERIVIAYSTDSKDGTKLRHLTNEELIKAKDYINDYFLSDYWLYSNLEK